MRDTSPLADYVGYRDELDLVLRACCLEKEAAKGAAEKDLVLWQQWNASKDPQDMDTLFKQVRPIIAKAVNVYAGKVNIPTPAIQAEFERHALSAIKTYDPTRSALHTHITNQLNRGKRFVVTYQNVARVPENRSYRIGEFLRAKEELGDNLGREPSSMELADHMKWPVSQIAKLEQEMRAEVPTSHLEGGDLTSVYTSPEAELLQLLPGELTGEEKLVYEYVTGSNGKPKLSGTQIAQRTGLSPAKVSRLRSSVATKVKKYYRG
jgi:DNA-directed RNA polymerase specialized sigma subunit